MTKPASYYAACEVGGLIEARLTWLGSIDDVLGFQRVMNQAFAKAGSRAIICADWRDVQVLPPVAGDALIDLLRSGNGRFVRSGVLLTLENAVFALQVERLFREAQNPQRRAFRDPNEMLRWLSEAMTPDERQRARGFLIERREG